MACDGFELNYKEEVFAEFTCEYDFLMLCILMLLMASYQSVNL